MKTKKDYIFFDFDGTLVDTGVDGEFEEFVCLGHSFGLEDGCGSDIHRLELLETAFILLRGHIWLLSFLCGETFGLDFLKTCGLGLDDAVLHLCEEQLGLADTVSGLKYLSGTEFLPLQRFHIQDMAQLFAGERSEGIESDGKVGTNLEGHVENGCGPCEVGLGDFPGLGVGNVFVADAGYLHSILERFAEMVGLYVPADGLLECGNLFQSLAVNVLQL